MLSLRVFYGLLAVYSTNFLNSSRLGDLDAVVAPSWRWFWLIGWSAACTVAATFPGSRLVRYTHLLFFAAMIAMRARVHGAGVEFAVAFAMCVALTVQPTRFLAAAMRVTASPKIWLTILIAVWAFVTRGWSWTSRDPLMIFALIPLLAEALARTEPAPAHADGRARW